MSADGRAARTGQTTGLASGRLVVKSTEDQVYEMLRIEILGGVPPGTPLRLSAIASRLGVSTMPVRAALRRLEREGLVRQTARKGAVVAPLELQEIQEIQAIRWGIEGLAARLGATHADAGTIASMEAELRAVRSSAASRDVEGYLRATFALEDCCYGAAGRERLLATVRHYRRAAQRYVLFVLSDGPGLLEVQPSEALVDAATRTDGDAAERLIQHQIDRLYQEAVKRLGTSP